jgi:NAD(P)-dependent dehydrogenase (short-subunit alcohol dehydrogenase family)
MRIKDRTAVVTGANRGIGEAFVRTLLEHGPGHVYRAPVHGCDCRSGGHA